ATGNRLVEIGADTSFSGIGFVAYEGTGSIGDGSFQEKDIETVEFMANGQLRFALYGTDGQLETSSPPALTTGGKPSKCLWCHEVRLKTTANPRTDVPGYYTAREFAGMVGERMGEVVRYRSTLNSRVDFTQLQDHTQAELLYIAFMEPSLERLANE